MAARAIWKGSLKVGGAAVPVKLFSAVEDKGIHFHLLEKRSLQRIKQHMVDPQTGKEVPKEEIRKGYEIEPDTFVVLEAEDLEALQPEASRDIEITHFVPEGAIVHQFYERPYYLGPDGDADGDYFALADALEKQEREGIAKWVMRGKQNIGSLRVRDGYLLLMKLRYAEEVLSAQDLPAPAGRALDQREIQMAEQLVNALAEDFRPEEFRDEYRDRVLAHIEAKAKGLKPKLAAVPKRKAATSLLEVLEASLASTKGGKGKRVA